MAAQEPPRFILFVPPPPSPPSPLALKTAFGDTISQVLKEVATASTDTTKAAVLEIALACPHLAGKRSTPRAQLYDETQTSLASIYKLVCVIAAAEQINVEDRDGVDVRLIPVAWSPDGAFSEDNDISFGPIVSLTTLARSSREWQYAFGVESETGETMVRAFIAAKGSGEGVSRLQGQQPAKHAPGSGSNISASGENHAPGCSNGKHNDVAVGGTFDHIHIGHKLLLTMTLFAVDERSGNALRSATIGITGDQLLKNKKHASVLESWSDRQEAVQAFCDALLDFSPSTTSEQKQRKDRNEPGPNGKSVDTYYSSGYILKCTEIQDPFGPTITEEQISALVVSAETRSGGKAVNDKRKEKGWKELDVFEVDVLDADDSGAAKECFERKLSSTAIREKIAKKQASNI